ncbi:uncharacterized protein ACDP82_015626 [Pangshura tecta]
MRLELKLRELEDRKKRREHDQQEKERQREHDRQEKERQREHEEKQREHEERQRQCELEEKESQRKHEENQRQRELEEKEKQRKHELDLAQLKSREAPTAVSEGGPKPTKSFDKSFLAQRKEGEDIDTFLTAFENAWGLSGWRCNLVASSTQMSREIDFCGLKFCGYCSSSQLCSTVLYHPSVLGGHEQKRLSSN